MTTTSADVTKQQELNRGKPDKIATVFQAMKLGNMLAGSVKVTAAALAPAATFDITTAAVRAASTISGLDRESSDNLPPIMVVKTLRVTASGTANSVGSYIVSDAAGTALSPTAGANVGIALLSDDGKSVAGAAGRVKTRVSQAGSFIQTSPAAGSCRPDPGGWPRHVPRGRLRP